MSKVIIKKDTTAIIKAGIPGPPGTGGATGPINGLTDVTITLPVNGHILEYDAGQWVNVPPLWSHSDLTNLGADDHTNYHNDTRGDARYYTKTLLDNGHSLLH